MISNLKDLKRGAIRNKVICFGHFSYLHAGHIRYFNYASKYEKDLCVVIAPGPKDNSDSAFDVDERINLLQKVCDIDNFVICGHSSLHELISKIDECELILGKSGLSHFDMSEVELVAELKRVNSKLVLWEGDEGKIFETLSSSTEEVTSRHIEEFRFRCNSNSISLKDITRVLRRKSLSKILVIGDLIVDDYVATEPLGISAEAPVIVVREVQSKRYVGGAGVVAKHLSALGGNVSILSVVGEDCEADFIRENLWKSDITPTLIVDSSRPTIYKRRYISGHTKLLRVSRMAKSSLPSSIEERLIEKLDLYIQGCDAIVVSDFQYGVLNKKTILVLEQLAHKYDKPVFVDVQCSSQVGGVNKLKSCYAIFPTEKEARVTASDTQSDIEHLGEQILSMCNSHYCVLKLGEEGLILFERESQQRFQLPALSVNAIDVAGAGDSLLASVVYGYLNGLSMRESVALGSIVASLNVENLGNEPVDIVKIINRLEAVSR